MTIIEARKASLLFRVKQFGGPLNEPAILAQFLAQVMHESGGLRYVREIWGPTKAQRGYDGRKDLGNTQPGDGKRFMGRDVIQVTGRANYRELSKWAGFDFEVKPEALESPEWLGIGAIWYFLAARKDLIKYCREGNIEMVTRRVNGGLNGYADRLKRYDDCALKLLGFGTVRDFQKSAGLVVDGISGPKTRAALHMALSHVRETPKTEHEALGMAGAKDVHTKHTPAEALKPPAQRVDPVPAPAPAPKANAPVALVVVAVFGAIAAAATGAWNWLLNLFN